MLEQVILSEVVCFVQFIFLSWWDIYRHSDTRIHILKSSLPPQIITTKHQQKDKTLQYSSYLVALHLCLHVLKENILVQSKWKQTKNCNPSAHIGQPLPNQSALNLTKNTLSLESQWGLPLQSFSGILTNGLNIYSLCLLL